MEPVPEPLDQVASAARGPGVSAAARSWSGPAGCRPSGERTEVHPGDRGRWTKTTHPDRPEAVAHEHSRHRRNRLHRPLRGRSPTATPASPSSATTALPPRPASPRREVRPGRAVRPRAGSPPRSPSTASSGIVHAAGMSDPLLSVGMPAATVAANATGPSTCSRRAASHASAGASSCSRPRASTATTRTCVGRAFAAPPADAVRGDEGLRRPARAGLRHAATASTSSHCAISEAYGPGRSAPSLLEEIIDAAIARRPLRLAAGADQPYHLVHVEDVARAIAAALDGAVARRPDLRHHRRARAARAGRGNRPRPAAPRGHRVRLRGR